MKNLFILLITSVLLVSCGKKQEEKKVVIDDDIIAVKLANVNQANTADAIKVSGLIGSLSEARLSFKTGGIIEKILVKEGQVVNKGQLLATLNLTEINAQVSQANEAVAKAERDLKRITNLYRDSVATLEQVQNLTTVLTLNRQNLEIARYNQGFSQISSPVSGVIVKKIANEGELIGPGSPVFFVNATGANDWVVKAGIPDRDWTRLHMGDRAEVQIDAFPNDIFVGAVYNLSQGADQTSGLYQVELKINPAGRKMATGLFANAQVKPSVVQKYTSVPIDAIIEGNDEDAFVFVIDNGKAKRIPVKVAYFNNTLAYLSSGLNGINQVVVEGSAYLVEGSKVKVLTN
jgi:membrane fusion protein, multidrug efflux system